MTSRILGLLAVVVSVAALVSGGAAHAAPPQPSIEQTIADRIAAGRTGVIADSGSAALSGVSPATPSAPGQR
jgi:hypothetical protein